MFGSSPADRFDEFFTWLGKCISSWASVEDHLFEIYVFSLGATKQRTAIVYYRTPTLDARLTLTDELVRTVLPKREKENGGHDHDDVKMWNNIRKEIILLSYTRNRLAHHPVAFRQTTPSPISPGDSVTIGVSHLMTFSWYESYVSEAERLRGRHDDAQPITAPDLSDHRLNVELVIQLLEVFRERVLCKYAK